jgi:hypothetical protein
MTATGQEAASASSATVEPSNVRAKRPHPRRTDADHVGVTGFGDKCGCGIASQNRSLDFDGLPAGCHRSGGSAERGLAVFKLHPDITHGRERGWLGLRRDHFD